jgi:single-stranded-DNA-specific exonuclease
MASARIIKALSNGEVIGLETDHDVDGVTSHAVLYRALVDVFQHPKDRIKSYIGHRLEEGYGLSDPLCDRILADNPRPTLIITADNGSSDADRIARLKENGVDTIVTDHHGMPEEGPPAQAIACVSPARDDSEFPDGMIAGVMVSFLLMCVVRQQMMELEFLPDNTPSLKDLLDFVALGTVADCVSLARSENNRAIISSGLTPISMGVRPCWRAIRPKMGDDAKPISSSDLAFTIGPRLNAAGRLSDAMVGVRFLLSETDEEARQWLNKLEGENTLRREIEADLKEEAMAVGEIQDEMGKKVLQVSLSEGHAGVHGIVASRLVERYGKPAICFSPKQGEPGIITGSARGIEGMHVRDAMQKVRTQSPDILLKFGGHEGAGGLTLKESNFKRFEQAYEEAVSEQLGDKVLEPYILSDGVIGTNEVSFELIHGLDRLQPFGREFEAPLFTGLFKLMSSKPMGEKGTHWRFQLIGNEDGVFEAVWFNVGQECPLTMDGLYRIVFTPELNWWRGKAKMQLMIRGAEKADEVSVL